MKKKNSVIMATICALVCAFGLTACGSKSKWITPSFSVSQVGYTIELITNTDQDFEFPIEGKKLDHSHFTEQKSLEFAYVIFDSKRNIVGWIEAGGYDMDKKGNYTIGYSTSTNNDETAYWGASFVLILKSTDLSVFDVLEVTTSCGRITRSDAFTGKDCYQYLDDETGEMIVPEGCTQFVGCWYSLNLHELDWKTITDPHILITPKDSEKL